MQNGVVYLMLERMVEQGGALSSIITSFIGITQTTNDPSMMVMKKDQGEKSLFTLWLEMLKQERFLICDTNKGLPF